MAYYVDNLLLLIKFGIKLITVGQHVTQHQRKFNKTSKFCLALGFSPVFSPLHTIRHCQYLPHLTAYLEKQELSFPPVQILTCNCAIVLSQQAKNLILLSPKLLYGYVPMLTSIHKTIVAFVRNQYYKYYLTLFHLCFIV